MRDPDKTTGSAKPQLKAIGAKSLTPEQFHVTREHGTERAFSHPYHAEKRAGMYRCVCCGTLLFSSDTKFDSGTGWPSFTDVADANTVTKHEDDDLSACGASRCAARRAKRIWVMSFRTVPVDSGLRYCINGCALELDTGGTDGNTSG